MTTTIKRFTFVFLIPGIILLGLLIGVALTLLKLSLFAAILLIAITILGSYTMFLESARALFKKQFALDYIAMLAVIVSLISQEYVVAGLIALMISSGKTLEDYGVSQAKQNLTKLIDRIPNTVTLFEKEVPGGQIEIEKLKPGMQIFIRRGEVIPVDGILLSDVTQTDESSLTGEPYLLDKEKGDVMRSGTINLGDAIVILVEKTTENSTYNKIIELVKSAQNEKAPLVRLADRYSTFFTIITAAISIFAYWYTHSLYGVLAVLVVATPCPLILATPIALLGGINASAKKRVIMKSLASLEVLSRVTTFIFDKTGTITLGRPVVSKIALQEKGIDEKEVLSIAAAIERNSLHPLAKAIVSYAKENKAPGKTAREIKETIGKGIEGEIGKDHYALMKEAETEGMVIAVLHGKKKIAEIHFDEEIKEDSVRVVERLKRIGLELQIFTGDKLSSAQKVVNKLGHDIVVKAECSPEDKLSGIKDLRSHGKVVAMVGDGINDAPALALADVGIVFSNEEQTAASEAADVIFLGSDFSLVYESLIISKKTIRIALQSIIAGIGMSILCMILASVNLIPPVLGAFLQEAIDVAVIINALRTSRVA
ncbi:MAG: heavy metal translocating P-type ATPase [Candidatus Levyibacteriota bacterium]